jgi:hypothetical protein
MIGLNGKAKKKLINKSIPCFCGNRFLMSNLSFSSNFQIETEKHFKNLVSNKKSQWIMSKELLYCSFFSKHKK